MSIKLTACFDFSNCFYIMHLFLVFIFLILRVILVDIVPSWSKQEEYDDRMLELENLVSTYWSLVVLHKVQKRYVPDYDTYVWSWKLDEIRMLWDELKADVVIIWNILKPSQIYNINHFFEKNKSKLKAWDRVDLILKIFEQHASSPEARLQIELASIKHMWPRIFWMWMELSRQWWSGSWWGWWATRWLWETNTEIMKRHLKEKERKILEKLKTYENMRSVHRQSRKRKELPTVWIVWYTNAWKSCLLNVLTHKWALSEDKLFATLGTNVWNLYLQSETWEWREILLSDTIWFIRDLPPELIKAFSSTLEDSVESNLLLHVIDWSDPKIEEKIKIVEDTLDSIWAKQRRLYVINKIDLLNEEELSNIRKKLSYLNPIFVSSYSKKWLDDLKDSMLKFFKNIHTN